MHDTHGSIFKIIDHKTCNPLKYILTNVDELFNSSLWSWKALNYNCTLPRVFPIRSTGTDPGCSMLASLEFIKILSHIVVKSKAKRQRCEMEFVVDYELLFYALASWVETFRFSWMSFAFTEEKDCEIEFRPVGCYNDVRDSRALREEIYNEVDPSSPVFGGQLIGNWTADFPVFLCKCARIAKAKGYQYFGVNSFGRKEITGNDVMLHWYNKSD